MTCPYCDSAEVREHDTYCDDEHAEDEGCWEYYCMDCGSGFSEED